MQSAKGVAPRTMTSPLAKTSRVCAVCLRFEHRLRTTHGARARIEKQVKKISTKRTTAWKHIHAPAMTPVWPATKNSFTQQQKARVCAPRVMRNSH
jgi:hypothetical protein